MMSISEITGLYDWVESKDPKHNTVSVDMYGLCLDIQTSFRNGLSTVEEVCTEVFTFFDDVDSHRVIQCLNNGELSFGEEENQLLLNLFVTWIRKKFYDLRELRTYMRSKEMLGTLIELKTNEVRINGLQIMFGISVVLTIALVFFVSYYGFEIYPLAIAIGSILAAVVMGFYWNNLINRQQQLTEQLFID